MNDLPFVSLLVAIRNEADHISTCIKSLLNQNYPQDKLEVLIFDGNSQDSSKSIVTNLIQGRSNFQILDNPRVIQSAAWNLGLKESKGDIISIVSGHSEFEPDYVTVAVETLLRTNADMVGGTVRAHSQGIIGNVIATAISTPFGVGGARFRYTNKEEFTDTVFMGFCRRSVFEKIGGFDEELIRNQDDEFSYRLRSSGGHIICNPKIISYYNSRATLKSLWRQYYQYGLYKVRVLQKYPKQMSLRQFVPPMFVLGLIISITLFFSSILRPLAIIIPSIYVLANFLATVWTARKSGWHQLPLLPIIFVILHLSYGLGFLVGLFKFWNRWGDKKGKVPDFKGFPNQTNLETEM